MADPLATIRAAVKQHKLGKCACYSHASDCDATERAQEWLAHALERMSLHAANALQAEAELEQAFREGYDEGQSNVNVDEYSAMSTAEAVAAWRERRAAERNKT